MQDVEMIKKLMKLW